MTCACCLFTYTDCVSYTSSDDCESTLGCLWSSTSSYCYCGSNVTIDIAFAIDSSGSIGEANFEIELDWLSDYVQSSLTVNTRVGIINFSRYVYTLLNFQESESYTTSELADFIENDIDYLDSYTNTGMYNV